MKKKSSQALIICPAFFDYYKAVIDEFDALGFQAVWVDTWLYTNPVYKILLRVAPEIVSRLSTRQYIGKIESLELENVSEILVIKGEGLSIEFVRYLRDKFPQAGLHLYLWDGVENTRGAIKIAPGFDSVSTFDPRDALVFNWRHRPLFARKITKPLPALTERILYDWVFIGSLHSDRFQVLKRLSRSQRYSFYAYGFIPGRLIWFLRHLLNPTLWRHGAIKVSTRSIPPEKVNQIIRSSSVVVDIEHPKQRGLTMRSIETLLQGHKLVTTNKEIINSDLFHKTRVCVIDRTNPKIPKEFFECTFFEIPESVKSKYLIRNWLIDIIARNGVKTAPSFQETVLFKSGRQA